MKNIGLALVSSLLLAACGASPQHHDVTDAGEPVTRPVKWDTTLMDRLGMPSNPAPQQSGAASTPDATPQTGLPPWPNGWEDQRNQWVVAKAVTPSGLTISVTRGRGGLAKNYERWAQQMSLPSIALPANWQANVRNGWYVVDFSGSFSGMGAPDAPDARMLGWLPASGEGLFFKVVGPASAFANDESSIRRWIAEAQLTLAAGAAGAAGPADAERAPETEPVRADPSMQSAVHSAGQESDRQTDWQAMAPDAMGGERWQVGEIIVSRSEFASDVGGWEANVTRWSRQMGGGDAQALPGPWPASWHSAQWQGPFVGRDGTEINPAALYVAYWAAKDGSRSVVWKAVGPQRAVQDIGFMIDWQRRVLQRDGAPE
jgi:hypothetical protein